MNELIALLRELERVVPAVPGDNHVVLLRDGQLLLQIADGNPKPCEVYLNKYDLDNLPSKAVAQLIEFFPAMHRFIRTA